MSPLVTALGKLTLDSLPNLPVLKPKCVGVVVPCEVQDGIHNQETVATAKPPHVEHVNVVAVIHPDAHTHRVVALLALADGKVPCLIDIQLAAVRRGAVVAEHILAEVISLVRYRVLLVQRVPHPLLTTTDEVVLDPQHHLSGVALRVDSRTHSTGEPGAGWYRLSWRDLQDALVGQDEFVAILVNRRIPDDLELVRAVVGQHGLLDAPRPVVLVPPGHQTQYAAAGCKPCVCR